MKKSGWWGAADLPSVPASHSRTPHELPVFPVCHAPLCFCEVALRARRTIPLARVVWIEQTASAYLHRLQPGRTFKRTTTVLNPHNRAPASHTVARAGLFPAVTAVIHRDLNVDASCPLNDFPPNRRPWPSWVPLWRGLPD